MSWRSALSRSVHELRFHFCQTSPSSAGLRSFLSKQYPELKKLNPRLPMLIREASGIEPRMVARFDFGVEKSVTVSNLDEKAIEQRLEELVKSGAQ